MSRFRNSCVDLGSEGNSFYMFIIYNCGYRRVLGLQGKYTYKRYKFVKKHVTEVDDKDGEAFLKMTSKNITWCPTNDKSLPPFMRLKEWCAGKKGRFDFQPLKIYDPEKYKSLFLVKKGK